MELESEKIIEIVNISLWFRWCFPAAVNSNCVYWIPLEKDTGLYIHVHAYFPVPIKREQQLMRDYWYYHSANERKLGKECTIVGDNWSSNGKGICKSHRRWTGSFLQFKTYIFIVPFMFMNYTFNQLHSQKRHILDASRGFYRFDIRFSSICFKPIDFIKLYQIFWCKFMFSNLLQVVETTCIKLLDRNSWPSTCMKPLENMQRTFYHQAGVWNDVSLKFNMCK